MKSNGKNFTQWIFLFSLIFLISLVSFLVGYCAGEKFKIKINDKELKVETMTLEGQTWVPVKEFSTALGIKYKLDEEKKEIYLNAPAKFLIPADYVEEDDATPKNRYFFKLPYAQGVFKIDLYVNAKSVGTFMSPAEVELTRHLKKGKNELKAVYSFNGGTAGFYFVLQELKENQEGRINIGELDVISSESSPNARKGEKTFYIDAF